MLSRKMKVLCLVVLAVASVSASSSEDVDAAWANFKLDYGRQYRNLYEEVVRKAIFTENFNKIVEHNKNYAAGLVKFSMKINKYSDMTQEDMKKTLNGYKKSGSFRDTATVVQFTPDPSAVIPESFDWRQQGAVVPVKDQGYCGSCWAFSSTGALEAQYFFKTGRLVSISEQNLVDCDQRNAGCDGGDMTYAYEYVHENDGIDTETSYPYEGEDGRCRYQVDGNVTSTNGYVYIAEGNEEHLKEAIATKGPIAVAMDASFDSFSYYAGGIYYESSCSTYDLDHAVLAVGYGSENGEDYWIIKNSWGTSWGEDGYFRILRGDNNCGIATEALYPLNY
ncbi:hypothetical protein NQ317_007489 [Molorchus minor]|uniref:Cathepsin L n=1 Tax=Molorchus minor TaxID=1323400 RepID=A0ABQ9K2N8_9CUCU|nr:hypothetical protein NQ317_007489 [Molorchus minor]